jgi:hypothetical protein
MTMLASLLTAAIAVRGQFVALAISHGTFDRCYAAMERTLFALVSWDCLANFQGRVAGRSMTMRTRSSPFL